MRYAKLIKTDKWGTKEIPAFIYKENDDTLSFVNINTGKFGEVYRKTVTEKVLKGYTADAKKLVKEYVKAELKAKALEEQIRELRNPYSNIKEKLTKANGLLTAVEFVEELEKNGLELNEPRSISKYGDTLTIDINKDIKKWFGESEFTYREYDGELKFTEDCEETESYQSYIKEYGRKIARPNVKKKYTRESLFIGDKEWLIYNFCISIKLSKPMTAEYAKELVKKILE